jgi:hypothetical protein
MGIHLNQQARRVARESAAIGCRLVVIVTLSVAFATPTDDLAERTLRFEKPWNVFIRGLFGCEDTGETGPDTCKVERRNINRKAFNEAREAAKDLFDLKD